MAVQGAALQKVQATVQQAVGQDWRPLPQAMRQASAFQGAVNALVFDVLMDKVGRSVSRHMQLLPGRMLQC